jgi:cyclopropane fatty-acyl-phospholipid synthase-like methyltransferase
MNVEKKQHWETVYSTKQPHEVSWTQDNPATSLGFIRDLHLSRAASIIDIGGGDSRLVDFLIEDGYENITVLDISENAIRRAKERLGEKAGQVHWIVTDITEFKTEKKYDVWHDRAAFHFMTTPEQIEHYTTTLKQVVNQYVVIGTFSEIGPAKCSGLEVKRYKDIELQDQIADGFEKIRCITEDHLTPFNTLQNFLYCSFRKKNT